VLQLVGEKVAFALSAGLKVIACLGEHLSDREAGKTEEVIRRQINAISSTCLWVFLWEFVSLCVRVCVCYCVRTYVCVFVVCYCVCVCIFVCLCVPVYTVNLFLHQCECAKEKVYIL